MGKRKRYSVFEVALRPDLLRGANLRLLALLASLVLIVGGAFLVRSRLTAESIAAIERVSHTHQVRAALFELSASLNEMEAAAAAAHVDDLSASAQERYRTARAHYPLLLDRLRELTLDNPEQQERIGMMRARAEGRVALFDQYVDSRDATAAADASRQLAAANERFPTDDLGAAIVGTEEELVQSRQADADARMRTAQRAGILIALVQVVLLGVLIWLSERQLRRRVVAETAAGQAVARAQLIVETVREPIAVLASDLTLLQTNQAFADFYRIERPLAGARLTDIPAWSDTSLHQRLRDVSSTLRELWDYETAQQTTADVLRNVVVNARPMTLPDSSEQAALLTVSDMTARKRSEEQVLELNRQLEGKIAQVTEINRELEAFSYSVSHDLRAPLRHIAGFAEKLRASLGDAADAKTDHYCNVIADSARRMSALIEDLLAYSRLGRHALRLQPVDMQAMVEELRATLMSGVEDRRVSWRVAPLPVAVADASMIRLAWQNLLENAIKYSSGRADASVEVGFSQDTPEERVFWVRDNGAGFDMKYADKLFGVFQRLHKASAFAGTGIGLASVRRIVSRHGGRTWAEGVPDQGATFYFSLPRHELIA